MPDVPHHVWPEVWRLLTAGARALEEPVPDGVLEADLAYLDEDAARSRSRQPGRPSLQRRWGTTGHHATKIMESREAVGPQSAGSDGTGRPSLSVVPRQDVSTLPAAGAVIPYPSGRSGSEDPAHASDPQHREGSGAPPYNPLQPAKKEGGDLSRIDLPGGPGGGAVEAFREVYCRWHAEADVPHRWLQPVPQAISWFARERPRWENLSDAQVADELRRFDDWLEDQVLRWRADGRTSGRKSKSRFPKLWKNTVRNWMSRVGSGSTRRPRRTADDQRRGSWSAGSAGRREDGPVAGAGGGGSPVGPESDDVPW